MKQIGITGGIGSGKSTVCRVFSLLGIPVFDADTAAKSLYDDDPDVFEATLRIVGKTVLNEAGKMDRKKLAALLFADEQLLKKVNDLVHPAVAKGFDNWCAQQQAPYVLKEAAILFESGAYKQVDAVIVVTAPETLRIERVLKRESWSREELERRIRAQWDDEKKLKMSTYNIRNDETALVIPQVLSIHGQICG